MIPRKLSDRADDLRAHGEPFVTATVVRAQRPTSAMPGNVALIHRDGTIEGFVGGVCAQQSVRRYSLQAIQTGQPLLLRITPDEAEPEVGGEEGAVTVQNPCLSGGAIEMFLEPFLPAPRVLVVGDSPIVEALAELGAALGLDMVLPVTMPPAAGDLAVAAGDLAVVVAAHGRNEIGVLRTAVEAGIPYVGLVASRRRGAGVIADLRAAGLAEELVARIETPAGIDIGARTPPEIALSILARIVEVRRARDAQTGALGDAAGAGGGAPVTAVDPICGMTVVVGADTPSAGTSDETVYFCCEGCRQRYELQAAG